MAALDLTCLRILKGREQYEKYSKLVPKQLLDAATQIILADYGRYFKDHPTHNVIDPAVFKTAFFGFYHPKLTDEQRIHYGMVVKECLQTEVDEATRKNFINNVIEQDYSSKIAELLHQYNEGGDIDIIRRISALIDAAEKDLDKRKDIQFIEDDIGDLISSSEDANGIRWRMNCLQTHMRPMIGGDFGIIAGRPDTGKTTMISSELTYMASQIPDVFGDRSALWLNNEGPGRRIKPRLYQAALDLSISEMVELHRQGQLVQMYSDKVKGLGRIKILDVHGWWNYEVQDVIESVRPAIVVFDMIDNLKFAGVAAGSRTDQALEGMYQWAREGCVKYDFIGLATSQISNEGDNLLFPTLPMLKDSKTGKQGACDFQIMIGRSNDFNSDTVRGIGVVKNKLRVDGKPGDPRAEVIFDGVKSRYRDA